MRYTCNYYLEKGHETDSGYDVRNAGERLIIKPFETVKIPTSLKVALPEDIEIQVRPKSSLSAQGLLVHLGTVDSGYRGEILVVATNLTNENLEILPNQKVAQVVFNKKTLVMPLLSPKIEDDTSRGTGGFGSTGRF